MPTDGVAETKVSPAGSGSATETARASSGPPLVTVTVNVTFVLSAGVALLTVLVTPTLAIGSRTWTSSPVLLAGL